MIKILISTPKQIAPNEKRKHKTKQKANPTDEHETNLFRTKRLWLNDKI